MITWENYEEYIMMHADGELQPAEEQELMAFLEQHPELKSEMDTYERIRLIPEPELVFAHKESLLKSEAPAKRIIAFPNWQRYSIAAGIAAIIFISLFKYNQSNTANDNTIAQTKVHTAKSPVTTPYVPATPATARQNDVASATKDTTHSNTQAPNTPIRTGIASTAPATPHTQKQNKNTLQDIAVNKPTNQLPVDNINTIAPVAVKPFQGNSAIAAAPAMGAMPELVIPTLAADEPEEKRSLLDKLPINEVKKKGLVAMASAVVSTYDKVHEIKDDINEKSVTIKVEKRKFTLSF